MEHYLFFLTHLMILLFVIFYDIKNYKIYVFLGLLVMLFDMIFEIIPIAYGIWTYNALPKIFGISLYTLLLYVPYLGFCYFAANKVKKHV